MPQWSNYAKVFAQTPFARYFLNTFITASVTTIVSLFNSVLGAFAMVNLHFKGKYFIQIVLLSLLMVPGEAIILRITIQLPGWDCLILISD